MATGRMPPGALQQRNDLRVENAGGRVGTPAAAQLSLVRGQSWILVDTVGRCHADRRLRRGDGRRMDLTELHVEPHLMVGYVAAGHKVIPPNRKPPPYPAGRDHQKDPENGCRRFDLIVAPHVGRAASEFACSGPRGSPSLDVVDDTTNIAIAATRRRQRTSAKLSCPRGQCLHGQLRSYPRSIV